MVMVFFFNDTATTEIYTLSLHDALPISGAVGDDPAAVRRVRGPALPPRIDPLLHWLRGRDRAPHRRDRKSTRLNSSHANISYAVFCLKKKIILFIIYVHFFFTLVRRSTF